jgi:hypothetical protein
MPAPQNLLAATQVGSPMVTLDWDDATDPRVAGYRVYERAESGEFVPYGSSDVSGYADLFAGFRDKEKCRVSSYSARGIESEGRHRDPWPKQGASIFRDAFEPRE